MTFSKTFPRTLLAFVAIAVIQVVAGMMIPMKPVAVPHLALWMLLSLAITVAALSAVAARTEWRGWHLGAAVSAIPLIVFSLNLIEAIVFLPNTQLEWGRIFLYTLVSAVLSVPVWAFLFGRRKDASTDHYRPIRSQSRGQLVWKFVLCDLLYVFLYFAVGAIIFPYVKDFYATQRLPSNAAIAALQFFVRGPLFILLALAITRMLGLPQRSGAFAVGLVFTLLTGVATLLVPNPVFPNTVRWAHFCEVTSEMFIFGVVVAWLWGPPMKTHSPAVQQAA
ncbi:MAG: hypothetical protein ABSE44_11800 [Candidatus Sulfotelmatobacter sp.]|jgi:hypothetical protein